MSTRVNPIRIFVTHTWEENDDYARVFEYLEAPGTFHYHTTSQPQAKRPIDRESQREDLRRQIAPCEVVIVLPAAYRAAPDLVLFQMQFAKSADRPVVAMENFGSTEPIAKAIADLADEVSAWNERSLIDALQAAGAAPGDDSLGHDRFQARLNRGACGRQFVAMRAGAWNSSSAVRSTLRSCTMEATAAWCRCASASARHTAAKVSTMRVAQSSACWFESLRTEATTGSSPRSGGTPAKVRIIRVKEPRDSVGSCSSAMGIRWDGKRRSGAA